MSNELEEIMYKLARMFDKKNFEISSLKEKIVELKNNLNEIYK